MIITWIRNYIKAPREREQVFIDWMKKQNELDAEVLTVEGLKFDRVNRLWVANVPRRRHKKINTPTKWGEVGNTCPTKRRNN